jgi:hypothetical protein
VKKYFAIALLGGALAAVVRRVQASRAEQDLWTEATDPIR